MSRGLCCHVHRSTIYFRAVCTEVKVVFSLEPRPDTTVKATPIQITLKSRDNGGIGSFPAAPSRRWAGSPKEPNRSKPRFRSESAK